MTTLKAIGTDGFVTAEDIYNILFRHWRTDKTGGIDVDWITKDDDDEDVKGPDGKIGWWNGSNPIIDLSVEPIVIRIIVSFIYNNNEMFFTYDGWFHKLNLHYTDFQLIADEVNNIISPPVQI